MYFDFTKTEVNSAFPVFNIIRCVKGMYATQVPHYRRRRSQREHVCSRRIEPELFQEFSISHVDNVFIYVHLPGVVSYELMLRKKTLP